MMDSRHLQNTNRITIVQYREASPLRVWMIGTHMANSFLRKYYI